MSAMRSSSSGELHELGLLAAARAIRNGEGSSEVYVGKLLERASGHADFNAFITIDEASVLETARQADRFEQDAVLRCLACVSRSRTAT
jgi:indoleacetamide hydrolase